MRIYRITDLLDLTIVQKLAESNCLATGMPIGIIDAIDGSILVGAGWQDICTRFHRVHPISHERCRESDNYIKSRLVEGEACHYKCKNGLRDIGIPIVIKECHLATLFIGQFFYEGEIPERELFIRQAGELGYDLNGYLAALDRVSVFSREKVDNIVAYDITLARFIADLATSSLNKIEAEETLREREERFRSLVETTSDWIWEIDTGGVYTYSSPKAKEILGYESHEIIGKAPFDFMPAEEAEHIKAQFAAIVKSAKPFYGLENVNVHKSGQTIVLETNGVPIFDGAGKLKGYRGVDRDITERKLTEETLRESEGKFRVLAETSMAGIALYQGENYVYSNPATARIFGCTVEELLKMKFWDWAHEDFKETVRNRGLARLRGEPAPTQYECRIATKGEEERWVIVSVGCIEYMGKPAGIVTFIDITETKRAEEQLRASLSEKEILLKEIHHRVKNNLQVICTLLELQSDYIVDDRSRKFFMESQDRIRSMALVHEKLYQSKDFSCIDFAGYINSLTNHLYRSYVTNPELISLSAEVGNVTLGIDEAIPCGLIINELVSNSLKYAFPDGRKGDITVRFHADDQGLITLTVADNGAGFPAGLNFRETDSLGLQLVNMLTTQLRGDIDLLTDQGTSFTIHFKG
jgi:PAS domain S-box-containing protein